MQRFLFSLILIAFSVSGFAEESDRPPQKCGKAAGYATRDATVLSIMGWGVGLFAGIAALFALMDNNTESEGSGTSSH